ncbi:MAG: hypothetical protein AMJ75_05450, partial [Phycisphaerae bacterium SM1_79]
NGRGYIDYVHVYAGDYDTTPPAVPTGLTATAGDAQVSLDWADNSEGDLDGYNVYRSTTPGGGYSQLNGSLLSSSDYTDNSVSNGTTYYYVVTAVDTSSNESGYSNEDSATPTDTTPPAAPTGLSATAGDATVSLDWNDNSEGDLAGYNVFRSTTSGSGYSQLNVSLLSNSVYTDNSVSNGTTYYYVVTAVDIAINESGYSGEVSATPEEGAAAPGLHGDYYDNIDFTNLTVTRVDATVNFNWGNDSPDPLIGADTFSIRWTGRVQPQYSETYTFYTTTDDGVRLWVNNQLIIDKWIDQGPTEWSGTISLTGEVKYGIKMEYYENGGGAVAELRWSSPSQPKEIIPQSRLYSDTTPPAAPTGLTATAGDAQVFLDWADNTEPDLAGYDVYRSTTSGGPYSLIDFDLTQSDYTDNSVSNGTTYYYVVTAIDTSLNESGYSNEATATPTGGALGTILREWWEGISGTAVSDLTSNANYPNNPTGSEEITSFEGPTDWADNYGTRISGYVRPSATGDYTFWIAGDDNCELWLSTDNNPANASLIANVPGWTSSREWTKYAEQQSSAISLTGGQKYYIEALHKEGGGGDNFAVAWQGPGITQQVIDGQYLSLYIPEPPLPVPWQHQDIGDVAAAGSASESGGTFTVEGSGADIWNNADEFHYVYQPLSGDGEIVACVMSQTNTDGWAKAGVMARETLNVDSTHAMMIVTPANGTSFEWRTSTGGATVRTAPGDGITAPYWVKLTRSGDTLTGYKSSDGSNWTEVGSVAISMQSRVNIGLCVTAHSDGAISTAQFDNVDVKYLGGWSEQILNTDGTINWTEYVNVANDLDKASVRDYLLGPKYSYFHPIPEDFPTLNERGVDSWEGTVCDGDGYCNPPWTTSDWYAQSGQLLYVPDLPDDPGVVTAANGDMFCMDGETPPWCFYYRVDWDYLNMRPGHAQGYRGNPAHELIQPNWTLAEEGSISNFDITGSPRAAFFGAVFEGFVDVPSDGTYTFYTTSDDGSRLYIGKTLVVDNDGTHGMQERSGQIDLKAGKHAVRVEFFEKIGGEGLEVRYEGPGLSKQLIPDGALYRIGGGRSAFSKTEAESFDAMYGIEIVGGYKVGFIDDGDWIRFDNMDFGGGAGVFEARVASDSAGGGQVEVRLDSETGTLLGTVIAPETGGWDNWTLESTAINEVSGIQTLYLVFRGHFDIDRFQFYVPESGGLRNPEDPTNTVNGLDYRYFLGAWDTLPDFENMKAGAPTVTARARGITGVTGYVAFKNGLIGTVANRTNEYGMFPAETRYPRVFLDEGKVPVAMCTTDGTEFVLVAVWDTYAHKSQVAVVAVRGNATPTGVDGQDDFLYGFPNWPNTKGLKVLGYIDLPFAAPTSIQSCSDAGCLHNGRGASDTFNLDSQEERDIWYNWSGIKRTARAGYAIVASRAENKVAFIDLQPLYTYYREMYFTTQANYDETKNLGPADDQWPYTFSYRPEQKPVVAYVFTVQRPTVVAAGLDQGDTYWWDYWRSPNLMWRYAYIATMDGTLYLCEVGGLFTQSVATKPWVAKTVMVGNNPTWIDFGNGSHKTNDLVVTCRGDNAVHYLGQDGELFTLLRDSRIVDAVMSEGSSNGRYCQTFQFIHVLDFDGKQVFTYLFNSNDFGVLFEFGGVKAAPGKPYMYEQDEVL